jgi:hypothetical protein
MDTPRLTLEQLNMIRAVYGDPGRIIQSPAFRQVIREELRIVLLEPESREAILPHLAGLTRDAATFRRPSSPDNLIP